MTMEEEEIEIYLSVAIKGPPTKNRDITTGRVDNIYHTHGNIDSKYVVRSIGVMVDVQPKMDKIITEFRYYRTDKSMITDEESLVFKSTTEKKLSQSKEETMTKHSISKSKLIFLLFMSL